MGYENIAQESDRMALLCNNYTNLTTNVMQAHQTLPWGDGWSANETIEPLLYHQAQINAY